MAGKYLRQAVCALLRVTVVSSGSGTSLIVSALVRRMGFFVSPPGSPFFFVIAAV